MLEPRSKGAKPASDNKIGTGRGTLRLRSKGPATVEEEVSSHFTSLELSCVGMTPSPLLLLLIFYLLIFMSPHGAVASEQEGSCSKPREYSKVVGLIASG